ncbi:MAG: glycosyltransferase family 25 protein [Chthoniobacterales bacterium]
MNKAFVINLDTEQETFATVQQELLPYGIECERFIVKRDKYKQIGCTISHLSLIAQAKEKKWPYLIVIEDDCIAREAMHEWPIIAQFLQQEKNRWDLFLGGALYVHPKKLHTNFKPKSMEIEMIECLHAVTAHFIIYNDTSYDRLLQWHDLPMPLEERPILDHFFEKCNFKIWVTSPCLAWQKPHHDSDFTELFEHAEGKLHYFTKSIRSCLKYRLFGRWLRTIS